MNRLALVLMLSAVFLSGCNLGPDELGPFARSVSAQVSGEATAWLVGKDAVVVEIANSPHYRDDSPALARLATAIAQQAIEHAPVPLESISITFHEGDLSSEPDRARQFIFLVTHDQPMPYPTLALDATGPLTVEEIQDGFLGLMEGTLDGVDRTCLLQEIERRAAAAGDPDTLDPATVEFVPVENWKALDPTGRRIVLMQALTTKAAFECID